MNTLTTTARRRRRAGYETAMAGRDLTEIRASYARWCMAVRRLRVARHVFDLRAERGRLAEGAARRGTGYRIGRQR